MNKNDVKAIFQKFDTSRDGNLDKKEMTKIFTALGINIDAQEFDAIFSQFDQDNNGTLDFEEFYHFVYVI